ncbi:MAG: N4-gp56 family major capsid protein [Proteobacteria bacterium]|nr:N4-gp56 family major capsid protein [Pseudomonadota bacterium]
MGYTEFGVNHPSARKVWGKELMSEVAKAMFYNKFMGQDENAIVKVQTELNKAAGDKITVDLVRKLNGWGAEGDTTLEGTDYMEALDFFNDSVLINQLRKGTQSKGKMSEQRVPHNVRIKGRDALKIWWAEVYDELIMMYLAGARGVDTSFKASLAFTGFAGNALSTPDNLIYSGDATSSDDLDSSDKMSLSMVERGLAMAETMDPMIRPILINGEKKFVLLMHTFDAFNLRTSTSENDWLQIQKEAGDRGKKNKVYSNALGEYADVILHKSRNVVRFDDYGSTANLPASRSLFLGAHAGIIAWGKAGGPSKMDWNEKLFDMGNSLGISAGSIFGTKRSTYVDENGENGVDFGSIAIDSYCKDPNAAAA